jgi:hypothetical protein
LSPGSGSFSMGAGPLNASMGGQKSFDVEEFGEQPPGN